MNEIDTTMNEIHTKGDLPAFLQRIQQHNASHNKRLLVCRLLRVLVHAQVCKVSSAAAPGPYAAWWQFISSDASQ